MARYLFNVSPGDRDAAVARLRAQMWGIGAGERHRDALSPGDLVLIYVSAADAGFIGRAGLATAVREWTPSEVNAFPGDSPCGVRLSNVELWDRGVPMAAVVARVDPTGSNPVAKANASAGFRAGVVRIAAGEYEAAVAASREHRRP